MIEMLQLKIHRAVVTDANLNYEGSITISADLMKLAGLREYQKVLVVDVNNGQRFETYVIKSEAKNVICLNGAAARLVSVGDRVIIMAFCYLENVPEDYKPRIVLLDENNDPL
ncbi:MAG: aspartate 1-decarboxylase [Oscillospiraceae bacterium]|jgi:aspartate 1-decarboxylase|nr:aspartate 1-decarboxylase [Oscillospiraceae bacterium]